MSSSARVSALDFFAAGAVFKVLASSAFGAAVVAPSGREGAHEESDEWKSNGHGSRVYRPKYAVPIGQGACQGCEFLYSASHFSLMVPRSRLLLSAKYLKRDITSADASAMPIIVKRHDLPAAFFLRSSAMTVRSRISRMTRRFRLR